MNQAPPLHLKVIGLQRMIAPDQPLDEESLKFYVRFFESVRAVQSGVCPIRYLRFEGPDDGGRQRQFIGVEVEEIRELPPGMMGWSLSDDRWRIHGPYETAMEVAVPVQWDWIEDTTVQGRQRPVGEFHIRRQSSLSGPGSFWLSANAYTDWSREIDGGDSVSLAGYDARWPARFADFAGWLEECLGPDLAQRIEHFGSTAIPGMPAKPIIDVAVQIPSFDEARRRAIPMLNRLEWEYWWDGGHMMFIRRDGFMGRRTHHVHMAPPGHPFWERLAFRDYLRAHPDAAMEYAELKKGLAERHPGDREHYTLAKGRFVRETTAEALEWQKGQKLL